MINAPQHDKIVLNMETLYSSWINASNSLSETKIELCDLADELARLDLELAEAKEIRYEEVDSSYGDAPIIRSLVTLQKELIELVADGYDAKGKTKDERAADLLKHVKATHPLYNMWEERIERSEQQERHCESQINSKTRQFTAVQKRMWAEQEIMTGLNRLIQYCSAKIESENTVKYQQDLLATERRVAENIHAIREEWKVDMEAVEENLVNLTHQNDQLSAMVKELTVQIEAGEEARTKQRAIVAHMMETLA